MKKKYLLTSLFLCIFAGTMQGQGFHLQPVPQIYQEYGDSIPVPVNVTIKTDPDCLNTAAGKLLATLFPTQTPSGFPVYVGTKGDKAIRKYNRHIPQKTEGYYLHFAKDKIIVAGADDRGTYYGLQTLSQLLSFSKLPQIEITDYPDIPYRGVVEGFYGTPWTHEARLRQLEFYGKNKMNIYLYGPKDDPYHSTPNWRKPYPEKEAAQLKELVEKARQCEVIFYWAIHPGQDIKWNEEDRTALINKFEHMYQLGVRAFAVFFDDISGEGTKAEKQAELLNFLDTHFVKPKGDVAPLVICPTEYNKSWSNLKGGYLKTLGQMLNPGIEIMWTGDRVIACIDQQSLDFINPLLQRKAYIWWNFPVSDYVRDHLLMGKVYGNATTIGKDMSGFVANPMEHAEASKIALYSVADYAWNPETYQEETSWKLAIRNLMPQNAAYLQTFANHNSDLGKNGHGFRREESVEILPTLNKLVETYRQSFTVHKDAFEQVEKECQKIVRAADILSASDENPNLVQEITPWLIQFKLLGEYGMEVLHMLTLQENLSEEFMESYRHACALQKRMYQTDITYNQNPYQPGVKTGSLHLLPAFHTLFEIAVSHYNKLHGCHLPAQAVYMPYSLQSNVSQLAQLPIRQRGRSGEVSPSNEIIIWQAEGYLTILMDGIKRLKAVEINLGSQEALSNFTLQISTDGKEWQPFPTQIPEQGVTVQYLRLTNTSGEEQKVYFKKFRFVENN